MADHLIKKKDQQVKWTDKTHEFAAKNYRMGQGSIHLMLYKSLTDWWKLKVQNSDNKWQMSEEPSMCKECDWNKSTHLSPWKDFLSKEEEWNVRAKLGCDSWSRSCHQEKGSISCTNRQNPSLLWGKTTKRTKKQFHLMLHWSLTDWWKLKVQNSDNEWQMSEEHSACKECDWNKSTHLSTWKDFVSNEKEWNVSAKLGCDF